MRIDEILARKRTLSFEVFPPKKGDAERDALYAAIDKLKDLKPDFVSVTYGAGGSGARTSAEIAGYIKSAGLEPLAHLTGGPSTPSDIDCVADSLRGYGVENVLALRGDRPADFTAPYCEHFAHASDLMKYIGGYGFTLGGACYPEGHPECATLRDDLDSVLLKQKCGAKFFITQMFYDNSYYYRLVAEARKVGVTVPIIPGIMPLVSAKYVKRIKDTCGSTIPLDFRNVIESYSHSPVLMREIGINYAVCQIIDLVAKGAPGVHLYVMNRADIAVEIYDRLRGVFNELFGN